MVEAFEWQEVKTGWGFCMVEMTKEQRISAVAGLVTYHH